MKRNLKALGLAMVAVFALGAMAASAAQAANTHHVTVASAPAVVTAKDTVNTVFKITGGAHEVECKTTLYEGTLPEVTNTSTTVTPTYKECKVDETIPTIPNGEIDVNHCAYVLGSETNANGHAASELECETGNDLTITYKEPFGVTCTVHVTPGAYRGVHYTQNVNKIKIEATVSGIKYHETKPEGFNFCPENHTGEDGTLNGTVEAEGFKHAAGCTALTGTPKTTPTATYYNECEGGSQKLTLNENVT